MSRLAVASLATALALGGCGSEGKNGSPQGPDQRPRPAQRWQPSPAPDGLEKARCEPDAANCRSASGRIAYVEAVDPDGDGDAHFVLISAESVTAPGISVIDVERGLRPDPLPGIGDLVSAAGPVYRGSYGQRQIEATELHVARP